MMRAPAFWDSPSAGFRARLLAPLGRWYGAATARRMGERGLDVGVPVVTIGNFVVGGAGKTPAAIAIAQLLKLSGEAPAFLSRGYGGAARPEPIAVTNQPAATVGDEPLLLARIAPTFVCPSRPRAAQLALEMVGPSVLICDDGLQSRALEPTLALAVVDGARGIGNALCVPAGPLRAPLAGQIAAIHATILIGSGAAGEAVAAHSEAKDKPCFYADIEAGPEARALAGERIVAFAGIGAPEKFFATLQGLGGRIVARRTFPDHHRYRPRDILRLQALARKHRAILVTTEKDAVRLPPTLDGSPRPQALPVELVFRDERAIRRFLARALADGRRS